MKMLVAFMLICFLIGGTEAGRWVRERPLVIAAFSTLTAASYWSFRVVLG